MDARAARGFVAGLVLGVIGADLYYAITSDVSGVDLDLVGVILMVAGAILAAFGLISALTVGSVSRTARRKRETKF